MTKQFFFELIITKDIYASAKSTDTIGSCACDETVDSGSIIVGCRAKSCQDSHIIKNVLVMELIALNRVKKMQPMQIAKQPVKLGGKDGQCCDKGTTACRLSSTKCTTDGTACIPLADCSTYKQAGCVIDAELKACVYDAVSKTCKQKTCADIKKTKSSDCAAALQRCVSNGTTYIAKAKCAEYTYKESCNARGTDGSCVFTSTATSATAGTCKLFSQCSDANYDQMACQSKSAACKWTAAAGTTPSSCTVHSCDTATKGTAKCVTVPNFDVTSYTVCVAWCVSGEAISNVLLHEIKNSLNVENH